MGSFLGRIFFKGFYVLLPLLITIWLVSFLFNFTDGILGGLITMLYGSPIQGTGLLLTIILIFLIGAIASFIPGEKALLIAEKIVYKIPFINGIYSAAKKVDEMLFKQGESNELKKACLVEYPRKGIFTLGFVTSESIKEISNKVNTQKLFCVFIPNTPTPATGFMIMVPAEDVMILDMKVEDAFKYIVSCGVIKPAVTAGKSQ
ncbi:MAG: DUF502 domain-containing protein [Candidatus Margulisiibacteriota bacterium]